MNSGEGIFKAGNVELSQKILKKINNEVKNLPSNSTVQFMHICGTHEYTIAKNGLRTVLPHEIEVISGPGCPVCVCPTSDIDLAIELSKNPKIIITTFGDMLRVPASEMTLFEAKAKGGDIRVVYSPRDAVELAKNNPDREIVFFSIGFETTAPLAAFEIYSKPPDNFSIICANKLVPPAFDLLMQFEGLKISGFILPGHVSAILGSNPYIPFAQKYKIPMVVAGFEVNDVLISILQLIKQHCESRYEVENTYDRVVKPDGNIKAKQIINEIFEPNDSIWRGIGNVPQGGLYLRKKYSQYDAIQKFDVHLDSVNEMPEGCLCASVLMGLNNPNKCPLFDTECTPQNPVGPCMVSHEGTCKIAYLFRQL